jgi:hypothetical protein
MYDSFTIAMWTNNKNALCEGIEIGVVSVFGPYIKHDAKYKLQRPNFRKVLHFTF